MRRATTLLLMLLLVPGLLLPAGMWLHVCRCERRAVAVPSCCHATPAASGTQHACCRHAKHHDAPIAPYPVALGDDCGCTWIALPDLPEPPTPPPSAFALPPALTPPALAICLPAVWVQPATVERHSRPRLRAPPPPGVDRNLPLRL